MRKRANTGNRCTGCTHYRYLSAKRGAGTRACHYILDTGRMRGCEASACTVKTTTKGAATA